MAPAGAGTKVPGSQTPRLLGTSPCHRGCLAARSPSPGQQPQAPQLWAGAAQVSARPGLPAAEAQRAERDDEGAERPHPLAPEQMTPPWGVVSAADLARALRPAVASPVTRTHRRRWRREPCVRTASSAWGLPGVQAGFPAQRNLRQAPQSQRVSSVGLGLAGALPGPPKGPGRRGGCRGSSSQMRTLRCPHSGRRSRGDTDHRPHNTGAPTPGRALGLHPSPVRPPVPASGASARAQVPLPSLSAPHPGDATAPSEGPQKVPAGGRC